MLTTACQRREAVLSCKTCAELVELCRSEAWRESCDSASSHHRNFVHTYLSAFLRALSSPRDVDGFTSDVSELAGSGGERRRHLDEIIKN